MRHPIYYSQNREALASGTLELQEKASGQDLALVNMGAEGRGIASSWRRRLIPAGVYRPCCLASAGEDWSAMSSGRTG